MKKTLLTVVGIWMSLQAIQAQIANETLFNFDFGSSGSAAYSGTAFLTAPGSGTYWTKVTDNASTFTYSSVLDSNSVASGLSLQFTRTNTSDSSGSWVVPAGTQGAFNIAPEMMNDYVYGNYLATFSGLTVGQTYRMILYTTSNDDNRIGIFTNDPNNINSANGVFQNTGAFDANSFVSGVNYLELTQVAAGTSLEVLMSGQVTGFQILAVPEPSEYVMTLLGFGVLVLIAIRKKQKSVVA